MKNMLVKIMKEILYIMMFSIFGIAFLYILNGKVDTATTIYCLEMVTNSIFISTIVILFVTNKRYIDNIYTYLSIALAGVGFLNNCFILLTRIHPETVGNIQKFIRVFYINNAFEILLGLFIIISYEKRIKTKTVFTVTIAMMFIGAYLAMQSKIKFIVNLEQLGLNFEKVALQTMTVLFYIYFYYRTLNKKQKYDEDTFIYINIFFLLRITVEMFNLLTVKTFSAATSLITNLILVLSNYFLCRIVIEQVIKSPNEILVNKSKNLDNTLVELRQKREEEEIKNKLLSNISHEFKTPVNVIYSAIQIQEANMQNINNDTITKYNPIIKQNCLRLIRLIDNFIDSCKFNSKDCNVQLKCENIVEIVEDTSMSVISFVESRGLELIFDTQEEEAYALIDKESFERVILNIISNSIKYNKPNGKIFISIFIDDDMVGIEIRDTGIGIPKDKQSAIFNRFERGDTSLAQYKEGSGLGLNIVCEIIKIHKGSIAIESEINIGTKVTIKIPKYKGKVICKKEKDYEGIKQIESGIKEKVVLEMADID